MKGGLSPADLVGSVWYDLQNAVGGLYADFAGVKGPASSSPLVQPDIQKPANVWQLLKPPPSLRAIQQEAEAQVAQDVALALPPSA